MMSGVRKRKERGECSSLKNISHFEAFTFSYGTPSSSSFSEAAPRRQLRCYCRLPDPFPSAFPIFPFQPSLCFQTLSACPLSSVLAGRTPSWHVVSASLETFSWATSWWVLPLASLPPDVPVRSHPRQQLPSDRPQSPWPSVEQPIKSSEFVWNSRIE